MGHLSIADRLTTDPETGARAVWAWNDYQDLSDAEAIVGRAKLDFARDRIEANGIGVFSRHHPFLGYLLAGELVEVPVDPPVIEPPVVEPPVSCPPCVPCVVVPPDAPPPGHGSTAIPEPGTFLLVAIGLVAVAARRACR